MRKCVGEVTQVFGEMKQFCWGNEADCWEIKQCCWESDTKIVGEMPQIQSAAYPKQLKVEK